MSKTKDFRIVIVGAGVAGLTLANCLQKAGIDYVLLEARDEIAPQVGASIAMMPNGSRILDQLALFDELELGLAPINLRADRDGTGNLMHPKLDAPRLAFTRSGYSVAFGDRQYLLQVLYKHMEDTTKTHVGKKLARVEQSESGVKAFCIDGSQYDGDVLVGTDGVYSKVRSEMWRLADKAKPGWIPQKEKDCMFCEYQCMYGICSNSPIEIGELSVTYLQDTCFMLIGGQNGRLYVFATQKMDKVYRVPNIPRLTDEDTDAFAAKHAGLVVLPNLTFGELWKHRIVGKLVTLEEADYKTWTFGRIACVGDSVHKMTPDAGQGGNCAVESAAALTNTIKDLLDKTSGYPSQAQVEESLLQYQQDRALRIWPITKSCNELTRIHTWKTWFHWAFAVHIGPRLGDALSDMHANYMIGATLLNFIPPPKRSLTSYMPFNPQQGEGYKESRLKRALLALPIWVMFYLASIVMDLTASMSFAVDRLKSGRVAWGNESVPLRESFYHIEWLDELWRPVITCFTSSIYGYDPEARWQMLNFLVDIAPWLAIVYIESTRRSNLMTFTSIPTFIAFAAQLCGIGRVIPIYFYLHYVFSPIESFRSTDMRLTRVSYTRSILPILLLGYYIPTFAQLFWPTMEGRQSWNWVWQMFPVWMSAGTWALSKLAFTDTMAQDRLVDAKRDLPIIKYTVYTTVGISMLVWWYVCASSPFPLTQLFVPRSLPGESSNLEDFTRHFLKWDQAFMFANSALWMAYLFWDMKAAGMVKESWITIAMYAAATTLACGPGAALGLGWLWREDVITNRRHKSAIVEGFETGEQGQKHGYGSGAGDEKTEKGAAAKA